MKWDNNEQHPLDGVWQGFHEKEQSAVPGTGSLSHRVLDDGVGAAQSPGQEEFCGLVHRLTPGIIGTESWEGF